MRTEPNYKLIDFAASQPAENDSVTVKKLHAIALAAQGYFRQEASGNFKVERAQPAPFSRFGASESDTERAVRAHIAALRRAADRMERDLNVYGAAEFTAQRESVSRYRSLNAVDLLRKNVADKSVLSMWLNGVRFDRTGNGFEVAR